MGVDAKRAKELFLRALEQEDLAGRTAWLERECAGDRLLLERVRELLSAHEASASGRFEGTSTVAASEAAAEAATGAEATQAAEAEATVSLPAAGAAGWLVAGRYKLLQPIGEGGMGTVWMADQIEPVRRRVAVKLIRADRGTSRDILARFEAERQAIAVMDHPHIAKLLDAGTTKEGSPYFVMELVKGLPLTEYCDQARMSIPERLHVFMQICGAVQHAHQKGIIHRDLKPSNILVENHDGKAVPKVIDFGLAKATTGLKLTENTLFTGFGNVLGTPLYMAPEQAGGSAIDVDTRADLYALGVILYELLTGTTPLTRESIRQAALDQIVRLIREQEPPAPSSRLSTTESAASIAANRQTEPAKLGRFVKGELDWIVLKALAKERDRRYDTASALARDVERFLNHEPVTAGPPTAAYRLRKFVRRHRVQVVGALLLFGSMVVGVIGTAAGLIEARRQREAARAEATQKERARAEEARQRQIAENRLGEIEKAVEVLGALFRDLDPKKAEAEGKPLSALLGERLDHAVRQLDADAISDPLTVARLKELIGEAQLNLGHADKAIQLHKESARLFAEQAGADSREALAASHNLASAYLEYGDLERAEELIKRVAEKREKVLGPDHVDTLASQTNLAEVYRHAGKLDLSIPLHVELLGRKTKLFGRDDLETIMSMNNLALAYQAAGEAGCALPLLQKALERMTEKRGKVHIDTLTVQNNLALAFQASGATWKAVPLLEDYLEGVRQLVGPTNPATLRGMNNLAMAYLELDDPHRAMPLLERTLELKRETLPPDHPETLITMNNVAKASDRLGDYRRAQSLYLLTVERMTEKLGDDHPFTRKVLSNLISSYQSARNLAEAVPVLSRLRRSSEKRVGASTPEDATLLSALGQGLTELGRSQEAESALRECLEIRKKQEPDAWTTFNTMSLLGAALLGQEKYAEAEPLLLQGYEGLKAREASIPPQGATRIAEALDRLVKLYKAWGKPDEAARWRSLPREGPAPRVAPDAGFPADPFPR